VRRVVLWVALGVGALVVVAGVAAVLALSLGRPKVRITSSATGLASVRVSGLGAKVTSLRAVADGKPVGVVARGDTAWPVGHLGEGETVRVTAKVAAPSFLRWLLGSPPAVVATVRTPRPTATSVVVVASSDRVVGVRFSGRVAALDYTLSGGSRGTVRPARATSLVGVPLPSTGYAGKMTVRAVGRPWERAPVRAETLSWFAPPVTGEPVVVSDPAPGATAVSSESPITLTFSAPVEQVLGSTRPELSPKVAGHWSSPDPYTLRFTPSGIGFGPGAKVTVHLDRAVALVTSPTDPASTTSFQFDVAPGSVLRLQQLLAQLGYLPVAFTPAPGTTEPTTMAAEEATLDDPLPGTFSWRWANTPASLAAGWAPGQETVVTKGALMAFEAASNTYEDTQDFESVDQLATGSLWTDLFQAALAKRGDPYPYSYVYVSKNLPETLTLYENGKVVLRSLTNTGIPQDPTADGTYPIYLRYTFQIMQGTNPDGSTYADPVSWINYFNGGDAVHGFVRASYGFPQSLGCTELPVATAAEVFPKLAIGDLVTVAS